MQTGNIPSTPPKHTLAWEILDWAERYIVQPDGESAGKPWRFTPEQIRFLVHWFAVDDDGRWVYSSGSLRRSKGWGKSPLLAALCIIEFIGPARFSHWDENGNPVGKAVPLPLVNLAATSIDQTRNVYDAIRGMLAESPAEHEYGLDIGKTMVQFKSGKPGSIQPVTASSRGLEGARQSFVCLDESHHLVESNQGVHVYEVLDRNVRKTAGAGSRLLESTNAFNPNEMSVAQRTFEAFTAGAKGLLYDCVEADSETIDLKDTEAVREGVEQAYADSYWVDVDGIVEAIQDPRTPDANAYRFYLNKIQESADTWIAKPEWDDCRKDSDPILPGDQIALGFDGSLFNDSTGLVGCRLRDGKLINLGLWERPDNAREDWEVDVLAVEAAVRRAFTTYRVEWLYGDPPYFQEALGRWAVEYGDDKVFEYWTNRPTRMVQALDRFHSAVMVGDLCHGGDGDLTRHVLNAVAREVPQGILISKTSPRSKRKIDLAVAAVLSFEARADAIADGRMKIRRARVVGF
ncbi:phage terminase family protein [Streptomyces sp. 769]|uniref:phage terminase family protein n=1 Tax=Streptomyces sp. 769 TaxID=1262452 RepID=UPI000B0347B7|nr:phage terminase family protein [Streptomyces sp. 769]